MQPLVQWRDDSDFAGAGLVDLGATASGSGMLGNSIIGSADAGAVLGFVEVADSTAGLMAVAGFTSSAAGFTSEAFEDRWQLNRFLYDDFCCICCSIASHGIGCVRVRCTVFACCVRHRVGGTSVAG